MQLQYARRAPAQKVSRDAMARDETYCAETETYCSETETLRILSETRKKRQNVSTSRPSRDRDVSTETTSLITASFECAYPEHPRHWWRRQWYCPYTSSCQWPCLLGRPSDKCCVGVRPTPPCLRNGLPTDCVQVVSDLPGRKHCSPFRDTSTTTTAPL